MNWFKGTVVSLVFIQTTLSFAARVLTQGTLPDTLTVAPVNGHEQFNRAFDQAHKTIDMVMYRLTEPESVQHILAARARGVDIRIIIDQKGITGSAIEVFKKLKAAGVNIVPSSNAFSITHEKAAVFDSQYAIISTINLTRTADYSRDFGILTYAPHVIAEMNRVFEVDWKNAQVNGHETPPLLVGRLAWSPVSSKSKIIGLINFAKKSVWIEVENLGDTDILTLLVKKAKSGVSVVVITPACLPGEIENAKRNVSFLQGLESNGVIAMGNVPPYNFNAPYIHAKAAVIDNFWFYVGSENFSNNSLNYARELGIIEGSATIAKQLSEVIQFDFKNARKASELDQIDCTHAFDFNRPTPIPQTGNL
jgi:cardiolipin synthase A/B